MNISDIITSGRDDTDNFPVTCENGCPDGSTGDHRFSCRWAGGPLFVIHDVGGEET